MPHLYESRQRPKLDRKGNKVVSITTRSGIAFRDITKLLAPSTNLRSFGRLFGLEQAKAHFPFSFLDSVRKLDVPELPLDPRLWASDLSGVQTAEEIAQHQREALDLFALHQCANVGDYLKVYLRLDVIILYRATQLWRRHLKEVVNLDFVEHRKFTISSLSHLAGQHTSAKLLRVGTFFPNHAQLYRLLRLGMRG